MPEQTLLQQFDTLEDLGMFKYEPKANVFENLNPNLKLRPYQERTIARFEYYMSGYPKKKTPAHLLFHMATGSGKTVLMATNILYLYQIGYRNFIFFVNSTNIIEKTKANFLTVDASKYLFNQKILFDHTEIQVKEVDNFEAVNRGDINILFTTIQGLHSRLNNPSENAITFGELASKKLALLSDEAHHINTLTKQSLGRTEAELESSWEYTVNKIFQSNPENIMLEYTATVELSHAAVREKYNDKIIVQYTLKEFREDLYSKEIKVLQSDIDSQERILHAIILSQHRRKVAEKNGLFLKPVILIKSRTIAESEQAEQDFYLFIRNLKTADIEDLKKSRSSMVKKAFKFFNENGITDHNLLLELKEDFREEKCLGINSHNDSEEKQLIVNSLEDEDNGIRIIFSVDKLKEGWDVLNLFDIVRLDESKGTKSTTVSEAQLIGRGARYFPFQSDNAQERFKRKYDEDTSNELRCLEELYYHSINNSEYICDLKDELVKSGIIEKESQQRDLFVKVKPEIKQTKFWQESFVFLNERIKYDRKKIKSFSDLGLSNKIYRYDLGTGLVEETTIFVDNGLTSEEKKTKLKRLSFFGETVCRKALDKIPFYRFDNLKLYFPNLTSINEFITSSEYSSNIWIFLEGSADRVSTLHSKGKLQIALKVYATISIDIVKSSHDYEGTKAFEGYPIDKIVEDRIQHVVVKDSGEQQYGIRMSETINDELHLNLAD